MKLTNCVWVGPEGYNSKLGVVVKAGQSLSLIEATAEHFLKSGLVKIKGTKQPKIKE